MPDSITELPLRELPPGEIKQITVEGREVCVANVDGKVYAVSDQCTHARIPLSQGALAGRQIICPWHGAMFDLATGRATCGPAVDPVRCYDAKVDGDTITVTPRADEGSTDH